MTRVTLSWPPGATLWAGALILVTGFALPHSSYLGATGDTNAVLRLAQAELWAVNRSRLSAPIAARILAVTHTCMYGAWAAYDERAFGTQLRGALRRPAAERTLANKERAISYAAYRALTDLFPADTDSVYRPLMRKLGYDPDDNSTDIETPTGIGNVACAAVLEYRHHNKSNQLGDLAQGAYSDWSGYIPVNTPSALPVRGPVAHPDRWQRLIHVDQHGNLMTQRFVGAQWCFVTPFALSKGDEFRSALDPLPAKYGSEEYRAQAEELIALSAGLTDRQKMIAQYWSDGPETEQPPGHWMQFAQFVSARDHHTLDDDVKIFFALSNALLDAGIAAWDAKRAFDSVRPVSAISVLFRGQKIRSWGGPGKGTVEMDSAEWIPYQLATSPTPPFPEYVSGHSTYSAAAARILALFTGSDRFGDEVTLPAGSSKIEPGLTSARAVMVRWETFSDAADEAGMSRRYGGIHFARADLAGRKLGRMVADKVWRKAQEYFEGNPQLPNHPQRVSVQ